MPDPHDRVEHDDGDARLEEEMANVERGLQRALAPVEHERAPGADELGDREHQGVDEEQADDEGDLAQRERVGLATELQVHDVDLGEVEHRREHEPGDAEAAAQRRQVPHERGIEDDAGDRQTGVEEPDPGRPGQAGRRRARPRSPGRHAGSLAGRFLTHALCLPGAPPRS